MPYSTEYGIWSVKSFHGPLKFNKARLVRTSEGDLIVYVFSEEFASDKITAAFSAGSWNSFNEILADG